jgi:hypothetical protein
MSAKPAPAVDAAAGAEAEAELDETLDMIIFP